jgi:hypothetical protein
VEALDRRQTLSLAMLEDAVAGGIEASRCLVEALRRGVIVARGRLALREIEMGTGTLRWRILDDAPASIPQAFWEAGGHFTDDLDHGVIAQAPGEHERWKDLRLNAEDCVGHWPTPATIFEEGGLSLRDALGRLPPEDRPIWLLTNPAVRATGLNASEAAVPIAFDRPLVVDPDKNAVTTEDGRLSWSAVTLDLAAPARPRRPAGRPAQWDWAAALAYLTVLADRPDGLPEKQAEAERLVAQWFAARSDGESPTESAIRAHVAPIYQLRRSARKRPEIPRR